MIHKKNTCTNVLQQNEDKQDNAEELFMVGKPRDKQEHITCNLLSVSLGVARE